MNEMTEGGRILTEEQWEVWQEIYRTWLAAHDLLDRYDPIEVALIVPSVPLLCPRCLRTLSYDLLFLRGNVVWPGDTVTDVLGPDPRGPRAGGDLPDVPMLRDEFDGLLETLGAGMSCPHLLLDEATEARCGWCAAELVNDYAVAYDCDSGLCVWKQSPHPADLLRENRAARIRAALGKASAVVPGAARLAPLTASGHGTVKTAVPAATLAPPRVAATAQVLAWRDR